MNDVIHLDFFIGCCKYVLAICTLSCTVNEYTLVISSTDNRMHLENNLPGVGVVEGGRSPRQVPELCFVVVVGVLLVVPEASLASGNGSM